MFRYGVLSIPVAALINSLCPGYALCAVLPAALLEKTKVDASTQTKLLPDEVPLLNGGQEGQGRQGGQGGKNSSLLPPSPRKQITSVGATGSEFLSFPFTDAQSSTTDSSREHPVFAKNVHPQAGSLGLYKQSLPTQANFESAQADFVRVAATSVVGCCARIGMLPSSLTPPKTNKSVVEVTQQPDLNRDRNLSPQENRFRQPAPEPLPLKPTDSEPVIPTLEPSPTPPEIEQPEVKIPVRKIEVIGSTVFGSKELNPITQPLEGRSVSLEELRVLTKGITQLYLDSGYITSRAVLVNQKITDGIVRIQVIEGRLEEIKIEGTRRLNPNYIRQRIRLGATTPLRVDRLEDQLRLLKTDPLFENVEASLRSGKEIGQSILVVRVKEANPFYGNLGVDNYSPPSVGSERFGGMLGYRNLFGIGDEISGSYYRSTTGGSSVLDLSYRVPFNAMNGTIQFHTYLDRNKITQEPFKDLDIKGESNYYEISIRQPLIRTPRQEFALSLEFAYKDGQTFLFNNTPYPFGIGPDQNGVSRTSVFRFGQDYVRRDPQGAWALRSQFSIGTGLFDATINESPIPDSRFFSWLSQVQRVQRLGNDHLLIVQGDLQLTPNSLLPSEQFVIGGGQSLRGYRQNVRSGDNGFRVSVEDRITLERDEAGVSTFQLAPFIALGAAWNHSDNPNKLPNQTFLAGAGLGLLWQPVPNLFLRVDYAVPFIDLDDRGTNAQDDGFYFSVNYAL